MANESFSKGLPSTAGAPAFVDVWRRRALRAGLVFSILAVILALLGQRQDQLGWDHVMRGWLEGFMLSGSTAWSVIRQAVYLGEIR